MSRKRKKDRGLGSIGAPVAGGKRQGQGESKTSPRIIDAVLDKQTRAVGLRRGGSTYQEIADELGYAGPEGAKKAVMAALKRAVEEPSQEVRTLEVERLDRIFKRWYRIATAELTAEEEKLPILRAAAEQRALEATDRCLKISAQRRALLGLDAPKKVEAGPPGAFSFAQLVGLAARATETTEGEDDGNE